jgi:hypothetical protein
MPFTKSWATGGKTGDGQAATSLVFAQFNLPDGTSGNLGVQGIVQGYLQTTGATSQFITGLSQVTTGAGYQVLPQQTLSILAPALPAVPGSGNTFWNVQVDPFTGVCTIFTSSTADPAPQPCAGGNSTINQIVIARQTLPSGTTNYSQVLLNTVDTW